jgi:hypothetical protein
VNHTLKTATAALMVSAIVLPADKALAEGKSTEELAKAAQNPIANMISLPLQNNTNLNIGPDDETQNILNIQPVWPFEINDDWNVITRTILPVTSNPDFLTGEGRISGIGDTSFSAFFSPTNSEITWGVGPVFVLPTASNDSLGSKKWAAGLSGVALAMPGHWVVGGLISNVWSFAGAGDKDINLFTLQPFINYNFNDGWYLTTAPIITANWEADNDHKWTVPIGGGVGKIFKIGKQPVNAQFSIYNNVKTPDDYGAEWQIRTQIQFLFPK